MDLISLDPALMRVQASTLRGVGMDYEDLAAVLGRIRGDLPVMPGAGGVVDEILTTVSGGLLVLRGKLNTLADDLDRRALMAQMSQEDPLLGLGGIVFASAMPPIDRRPGKGQSPVPPPDRGGRPKPGFPPRPQPGPKPPKGESPGDWIEVGGRRIRIGGIFPEDGGEPVTLPPRHLPGREAQPLPGGPPVAGPTPPPVDPVEAGILAIAALVGLISQKIKEGRRPDPPAPSPPAPSPPAPSPKAPREGGSGGGNSGGKTGQGGGA